MADTAHDLIFHGAPFVGAPVALVFGDNSTAPPAPPIDAAGDTTLGGVQMAGAAVYDNRVTRYLDSRTASQFQQAQPLRPETDARWGLTTHRRPEFAAAWGVATQLRRDWAIVQNNLGHVDAHADVLWSRAQIVGIDRLALYNNANRYATSAAAHWQAAAALAQASAVPWRAASSVQTMLQNVRNAPWQTARPLGVSSSAPMRSARRHLAKWIERVLWDVARIPPNGGETWPPIKPDPQKHTPSTQLLFQCPVWVAGQKVHLLFNCDCSVTPPVPPNPDAPLYILPARFYMSTHNVYAQLMPSLASVPIYAVQISADYQSWCWQFNASGPASLFEQLAPSITQSGATQPALIKIWIDDTPFVFLVERRQRSNRFGSQGVTISGRSATALLAAPYALKTARNNDAASTAQQTADSALDLSGFSLDWGLVDWPLPAAAFSHYGTPLEAVQTIAAAAGGYLQSHPSNYQLIAAHPYPHQTNREPWQWPTATLDVTIAADALITLDAEYIDNARTNGVYVSGTSQGVTAWVKRTGTDGAALADMVTDPLMTDLAAARQRGIAILGTAGAKQNTSISLPVLTGPNQPGILRVGQLVGINQANPWRGMVRSVDVQYDSPKLRQTVKLEQHLS